MARLADFNMATPCTTWSILSLAFLFKAMRVTLFPNAGPAVVAAFACDVGASAGVGGRWVVLAFASNDVGASAGVSGRSRRPRFRKQRRRASAGVGGVGFI